MACLVSSVSVFVSFPLARDDLLELLEVALEDCVVAHNLLGQPLQIVAHLLASSYVAPHCVLHALELVGVVVDGGRRAVEVLLVGF